MALDPTRREVEYEAGNPVANVSTLWLQQQLNRLMFAGPAALVEDGVWGTNTRSALGQFLIVLGVPYSTHQLNGETYFGDRDTTTPQRANLTLALERVLAKNTLAEARAATAAAGGGGGAGIAIAALLVTGGAAWAWSRRRGRGGMRGLARRRRARRRR